MSYKEFLKRNNLNEADFVKIETTKGTFRGTLLPTKENSEKVALKLANGYNVGIDTTNVSSIKKVSMHDSLKKAKPGEAPFNPSLPTIAILHTGGTIASRVNYQKGGVFASFSAEDLVILFPELRNVANIICDLVANIMSEDMRFLHYKRIANAAAKQIEKNNVKGIIIGHGTDTLGYTGAALSFMLENLPIPVILVGAQRSSDRGSSDAAMNLVCAAEFIAKTDFAGVAICMHENTSDDTCAILPATKTRKMHTSRRDAFKAINDTPIAKIDYRTRKVTFLKKDYAKADKNKKLIVRDGFEEKVAILKSRPNMLPEEFEFYRKNKFKGLVVEGTGMGHMQVSSKENEPNYRALKELLDSGCIVVDTSQCIFGRVHPTAYTNLRMLTEIGVICVDDMLAETAFIKLAWLLGNYSREEAKKLMTENLRGEITIRSRIDEFQLDD